MKNLKLVPILLILLFSLASCSNDDDSNKSNDPIAEMHLMLVKTIEDNGHLIEVYSKKSKLQVGYNDVYIRIKNEKGNYEKDIDEMSWKPVMHMMNKNHACPFSEIEDTKYKTLKKGYIVFTMASNDSEYWELNLNYSIGDKSFSTTDVIEVRMNDNRRKVMNFMGQDEVKYIVAYVNPKNPEVTTNDAEVLLFKMESMMSFPLVKDYTIKLDPRMPSMENHSSPNNKDFMYDEDENIYKGKLSLTMTGYWKLNLMVLNESGDVVGGTEVTDENESSNVYLELEF